jgi:membrane protein implicated in regulation of membrane protease activity
MKYLISTKILIRLCLFVSISIICLSVGWPVAGITFAILAFGSATVWVNIAHLHSSRPEGVPSRWLSKLERMRQYLADEDDELYAAASARR